MVIDNIEKIRKARGIPKYKLSSSLGYKTAMGYTHLSQGGDPTAEQIKIIAEVLNVKPAVFFDDKLTQSVIDEINNAGAEIA